jgi:CRISPR-associated protein Cas2
MTELQTFVVYDIGETKLRNRVYEACKDYGLKPIQYSCFLGCLSRNKQEELFLRLKKEVGKNPGNIILIPVCEIDFKKIKNSGEPLRISQVPILEFL